MSPVSGEGVLPSLRKMQCRALAVLPAAELPTALWCRSCVLANQPSSSHLISIIGFPYLVANVYLWATFSLSSAC